MRTLCKENRLSVVKRIIVVLDDPDISSEEHYLDLLAEDLESLLATRNLKLVEIKKGDPEKSPKS